MCKEFVNVLKTQEECFEPGMEMELKLIDGRIEEDCDKGKSGPRGDDHG